MMNYRVKVYRLNDRGSWDDGGTGHVQLLLDEVCEGTVIFIILVAYYMVVVL